MDYIIFLCGDVMLGRGIDQILKYKNNPELFEQYVTNATYYVPLNMKQFTRTYVSDDYVWGELLYENMFKKSNLKIINLETSITTVREPYKDKPVLYKMHPKNINLIKLAKIDYCNMANNHVLDWGIKGLIET